MKRTFLTLLALFLPLLIFAQDYSKSIEKADAIVKQFVADKNIPGMSISVYKDGNIVWSKGFGYADVQNKIPVNPSKTLFRIGSVSKTLAANAMGVLIQEGKLNPDATVQTYVPNFPEKEYPITIKQVAGHLAGIRHYKGDEFLSNKSYATVNEGLQIFANDPLLFKPGTKYGYSTYGYTIISAAIEGASGESFLPFIQKNIFDAIGMSNTMPEWANKSYPNRTKFYELSDGENKEAPIVDNSYKWAGGGFIATTEDLIKFGVANLSYDYLNKETLDLLMDTQYTSDGKATNYGMGWIVREDASGRVWHGHSGGSVGGTTMFLLNKEENMVIAYTINRSSVGLDDLHFKVTDAFLEK